MISASEDPIAVTKLPRTASTAATRIRIMLAAEALFGQRGIDAVSLREIAGAAGQGNSNAPQYHFGTKARLIAAIFEHRVLQFEPLRRDMLDRMARDGRSLDARCLVKCLCYPYIAAVDAGGRFSFAGFMAQYLMRYRSAGIPHPFDDEDRAPPALRALRELTVQRLCFLDRRLAMRRMAVASLAFCGMLVRWDSGTDTSGLASFDAVVRDTVEQLAAALCASAATKGDSIIAIPRPEALGALSLPAEVRS